MFTFFEKRIDPFPPEEPVQPPDGLVAFCWHYSKESMPWLIVMAIGSALIAIGEVALFGFMGSLIDWLSNVDKETFWETEFTKLFWMGVFLVIVLPVLVFFHSLIIHQVLLPSYPMIARWQMHRYLLRQSMNFFANEFAGRVATKVMQSSLAIRESVMKLMDIAVYIIVYFVSMILLVASADWRLVLPLLVWVVVYVTILRTFVPRMKRISRQQADARSIMTGRVVDSYTNITTVKLFSHAGREAEYARESMDGFLQTVFRQMRVTTTLQALVYFNNCVTIFVIAALSIWLWLESAVTLGAAAIAINLALRINGMSQWIMWETSGLFENIGVTLDGMSMMTKPHEVTDKPGAGKLIVQKGAIDFEAIKFHYGKSEGIIDDLSLSIKAGEKIGLVGRSGAGKTTLTNILLRFYDLEGGTIRIDGTDISTVTQDSLREQIGVVTQDTSLLHRSIRENIAYGRNNVTEADIIKAVKRANAWDFVATLEDQEGRRGLDAHVGERGVKLSGGQRQRIAIARVFLKDAPILVLDEATSALDSEVEAAIQENLFDLMEDKTVIAIAHRLSTIAKLDRLIVMDEGKIVENGTHDQLIAQKGIYSSLWSRQTGGFLLGESETA